MTTYGEQLVKPEDTVLIDEWHMLIKAADFPAEGKYAAIVQGWHVLVVKTDQGYFAVNDRCTHMASPLSTGRFRRGAISCPLHGARFDMTTGHCIGGAYRELRTFNLRLEDGRIEIRLPSHPPTPDDLPNGLI